jgi:hypothetical protein
MALPEQRRRAEVAAREDARRDHRRLCPRHARRARGATRRSRRCAGSGRRRLALDSVARFRAADGLSHSRALAFQFTLTVLPALIAVVGLAEAVDQGSLRRVVEATEAFGATYGR